jgi:O-antigen/teichoic acid export membrane protein
LTSIPEMVGDSSPPIRGVARWLTIGGFSILDQGLYAGTSFVTTILLARWLSPSAFGGYAIAFAVLTLLITLHSAVITEPLAVFGAAKYAGRFRAYIRFVAAAQTMIAIGAALIVALVGVALDLAGDTEFAHAFFGLAVAVPPVLLLWLARRAYYARFSPQWAALGGVAYSALALPAIVLLHHAGRLSPATAFLTAGAVSLAVALGLLWRLRSVLPPTEDGGFERGAVVADHARYARWGLAAALTAWLSAYVQYFVLGPIGFGQVGAMRALDTVLVPYYQYLVAMTAFLLPAFAVRLEGPRREARRFVGVTAGALVAQSAVVSVVLVFGGGSLMSLLYGSKYASYEHLLPWYGLVLVPETIAIVMLCLWRAQVRTRLVFTFSAVFGVTLLAAAIVGAHWGVAGVVVARVAVSYVVIACFLVFSARRWAED